MSHLIYKPPIYFVTTMCRLPSDGILSDLGARCIGYFYLFSDAEAQVLANAGNMNRHGRNPYVLIEKVSAGLHRYANSKHYTDGGEEQERWLYRYNDQTGRYEPMNEPDSMMHIVGIGIG